MLEAKILAPTRHSSRVANLASMRKKNGEIRLCVEFKNFNQMSLKENYPPQNMDHLLQIVTNEGMMSMLYGLKRYVIAQNDPLMSIL
jgi:hypothetical protein